MGAFKRSEGNDSEGVDVLVRPEVMSLDVMPMACVANSGLIEHTLNKCLQVGVIDDSTKVAFEMDDIDQIKPSQCRKQTDVCLRKNSFSISDQPLSPVEMVFQLIKSLEQRSHRLIIRRLSSGEARFVDAVVHGFIVRINHGIDVFLQILRTKGTSIP